MRKDTRFVSKLFPLTLIFFGFFASNVFGSEIKIAAASSMRNPLEKIVSLFRKEHPVEIKISYGASGALYAQLIQGAPFDIFLSVDPEHRDRLIQRGVAEYPFEFGEGQLVLWMSDALSINIQKVGMQGLLHPSIKRIAIAHPAYAPYGKAAIAALNHVGIYTHVKDKLIFGEDVAQAAHFVASGAADLGIVARSIIKGSTGGVWVVPPNAYPPIRQVGALLKKSSRDPIVQEQAEAFIKFMIGSIGH